MDTFSPSSWFSSVDFPELGLPMMATNPDLYIDLWPSFVSRIGTQRFGREDVTHQELVNFSAVGFLYLKSKSLIFVLLAFARDSTKHRIDVSRDRRVFVTLQTYTQKFFHPLNGGVPGNDIIPVDILDNLHHFPSLVVVVYFSSNLLENVFNSH